jgi:hypothetical protein
MGMWDWVGARVTWGPRICQCERGPHPQPRSVGAQAEAARMAALPVGAQAEAARMAALPVGAQAEAARMAALSVGAQAEAARMAALPVGAQAEAARMAALPVRGARGGILHLLRASAMLPNDPALEAQTPATRSSVCLSSQPLFLPISRSSIHQFSRLWVIYDEH